MSTPEELQTQIDAMKAFIGLEGYQAGQRRVREDYLGQLQNAVADAKTITVDKKLDEKAREVVLGRLVFQMDMFKRRIDQLDRELGPGEGGNRATRRGERRKT